MQPIGPETGRTGWDEIMMLVVGSLLIAGGIYFLVFPVEMTIAHPFFGTEGETSVGDATEFLSAKEVRIWGSVEIVIGCFMIWAKTYFRRYRT
jgi:hypothetical protein